MTNTFLLPAGSYCHGDGEAHMMLRLCVHCDNGVCVCVCSVSSLYMCTSSTTSFDNLKFVQTLSELLHTRLVVMFSCPYIPNHRQCISVLHIVFVDVIIINYHVWVIPHAHPSCIYTLQQFCHHTCIYAVYTGCTLLAHAN